VEIFQKNNLSGLCLSAASDFYSKQQLPESMHNNTCRGLHRDAKLQNTQAKKKTRRLEGSHDAHT
jgi:hypothetical protein